ncbi:hypothetical protein AAC387_Pa12g0612 [Persea americana]
MFHHDQSASFSYAVQLTRLFRSVLIDEEGKNLPKRDKNPRRLGKKREERNSTFSVFSLFLSLSDIQSSVRSDSTGYIIGRGFCVSQQGYRVEIDN